MFSPQRTAQGKTNKRSKRAGGRTWLFLPRSPPPGPSDTSSLWSAAPWRWSRPGLWGTSAKKIATVRGETAEMYPTTGKNQLAFGVLSAVSFSNLKNAQLQSLWRVIQDGSSRSNVISSMLQLLFQRKILKNKPVQQNNVRSTDWITNLPPDLVFVVSANAAGVVEQRAGEGRRLPAVWTVAAQLQWLLAVHHAVGVTRGRRQVRAVGPHSCTGSSRNPKRGERKKKWVIHIKVKCQSTFLFQYSYFKMSLVCSGN